MFSLYGHRNSVDACKFLLRDISVLTIHPGNFNVLVCLRLSTAELICTLVLGTCKQLFNAAAHSDAVQGFILFIIIFSLKHNLTILDRLA